jgi:hypothetical protein
MKQLAVVLLVLSVVGWSLQQADNNPPEDKKMKKLLGENKKRDNKKVTKKMLKMANETETLEGASDEELQADPGGDPGTGTGEGVSRLAAGLT